MSTHRFNCCKQIECAYMFIRSKTLGACPVFNTPEIRLWSNEITGHTAGLTGCAPVYDEKEPTRLLGYKNIGVRSGDIYHSTKLVTIIPGDNISYYGRRNDQTEDPKPLSLAFGSIVLPTKYKGIRLDNTVTDENGNLYYKYVKGVYPESISRFRGSFNRADYGFATQGITAGLSEIDVALFPVYYSDEFNEAANNRDKTVLFSIGSNINMPTGVWNAKADSQIGGCAPCRLRTLDNDIKPFRCFNIPLIECGGGEIPYTAFQAIPETINVLSLSLAICTDETDKSPVISITDAYPFTGFQVQKARLANKSSCNGSEIPDCSDENTIRRIECDGYLYNQICGSTPAMSVPYYTGYGGIGFGLNEGKVTNCLKFEEVWCDDPCAFNDCSACDRQPEVIFHYFEQVSYFPGYDFYIWNSGGQFSVEPVDGCASCPPWPFPNPWQWYCDRPEYGMTCNTVSYGRIPSCNGVNFTSPPLRNGVNGSEVRYETFSAPGRCQGDCCCCPSSDCTTRPPSPPRPKNVVIKKVDQTDVEFEINPYLMFNDDGKYFTIYDANIRGFKPDFGKYLEEYLNVWKQDRSLYPEAGNYTLYFKNPKCSSLGGLGACTKLPQSPEIFFLDESCFKSAPGAGVECRALCVEGVTGFGGAFDGVTAFYDETICASRINKLPTIDVPDYKFFEALGKVKRTPFCHLNKKHSGIDINKQSFDTACKEEYLTDPVWQNLEKYYEMEIRKQYGICNGEGVTLDIRYPIGLTLTDCTNVMSWEFISNAPKRPNPL